MSLLSGTSLLYKRIQKTLTAIRPKLRGRSQAAIEIRLKVFESLSLVTLEGVLSDGLVVASAILFVALDLEQDVAAARVVLDVVATIGAALVSGKEFVARVFFFVLPVVELGFVRGLHLFELSLLAMLESGHFVVLGFGELLEKRLGLRRSDRG